MTMGERIRQRRKELGLSQEELAHRLGNKSRASVCTVERDKEDLTTTRIQQYADALETTIAYLMGWDSNVSVGKITEKDLPKWAQHPETLGAAQDVTRKFDATRAQNADEMELLQGYRAASAPVRKIMLDAAKDALKGDSEKSSDSTDEESA